MQHDPKVPEKSGDGDSLWTLGAGALVAVAAVWRFWVWSAEWVDQASAWAAENPATSGLIGGVAISLLWRGGRWVWRWLGTPEALAAPAPVAATAVTAKALDSRGYAATSARFTREWFSDGTTMRERQPVTEALRRGLAVVCYVAAVGVMLMFGLGAWPAAAVAFVVGLAVVPRDGASGAWLGDCPSCTSVIVIPDPAMSAALKPLQLLCPSCTAPVEVVRDSFIAIPGTGPKQPA
jgi:hypothetical protein